MDTIHPLTYSINRRTLPSVRFHYLISSFRKHSQAYTLPLPMEDNPYQLTDQKILEPPTTLTGKLRYLGPSFVLSAYIVGSGEVFATTLLGAKAGFICLWVILFSCLVKVTIQLEFGKHAIYTGRTTMQALNDLPGPRLGKGHISIWAWLLIMSLKFLQVGGIVGGVALIFMQIPALAEFGLAWWTFFTALAVAIVVSVGKYGLLERFSLIMIGLFTIFTLVSVLALQWTDNAVSGAELLSGLNLQLPAAMILFAVGAFGITGVGGDEIMAYNYWLLEKGYAAHTGPRPGWTTGEAHRVWVKRARGWIKVMTLDAIAAMVCYTLVTVLFYILGAAILHRNGLLPEKNDMITQLGAIYTESLGPWAFGIFLGGALVVLFSTLFSALAAWTRLFSDAFSQLGWGDFQDPESRRKFVKGCAYVFPSIWGILFLTFQAPGVMVIIGGVATSIILLIVVYAAIIMHRRWAPHELAGGKSYRIAFVLSSLAILTVAAITGGKALGWIG